MAKNEEKLIPTPRVGETVQWFRANERREEMMLPATVVRIVGIGRVDLKIQKMGDDEHKRGVHHISDPIHETARFNLSSRENGSWQYIYEDEIRDSAYDYHRNENKKRDQIKTQESQGKIMSALNKPDKPKATV